MRNEIHAELTNYLTTILEELCVEKDQKTNAIDESIVGLDLLKNAPLVNCLTLIIRNESVLHAAYTTNYQQSLR